MGTHRIMLDESMPSIGDVLCIAGEEAQHAARVKRLEAGDVVELLDGAGRVASARIERVTKDRALGWQIYTRIEGCREMPRLRPRVEVWSAVPKGPRAEDMLDMLSQVGAAAWVPVRAERSVVDPREGKLGRLARVARESAKQCGRAWMMEVLEAREPREAFATDALVIVADASGVGLTSEDCGRASATGVVRVLIGPEGGWAPEEVRDLEARGAVVRGFGPHVMRIETAAVVACAAVVGAFALRSHD